MHRSDGRITIKGQPAARFLGALFQTTRTEVILGPPVERGCRVVFVTSDPSHRPAL
jgi:hypothetical protein